MAALKFIASTAKAFLMIATFLGLFGLIHFGICWAMYVVGLNTRNEALTLIGVILALALLSNLRTKSTEQ